VDERDGSTRFSLWAPAQRSVSLELDGRLLDMAQEADGWFTLRAATPPAGARYRFVLADGTPVPDPASRFQPEGVNGPSAFCPSGGFEWRTQGWKGFPWEEAVIYEVHVGAFTREGTFAAAAGKLPGLAEIGYTAIEIMPLAAFSGSRGWGYDGVFHYAPHQSYGTPDDFRRLIDAAHDCGMMVFLDVVYNHFGPEGNYLPLYAPGFFHEGEPTPWGPKIAFRTPAVRDYFIGNVLYWLEEYRLDGLRLDAIDQISDDSDPHILREISDTVHARITDRHVHLITENPANGPDLLAEVEGRGRLFVADWNDDFHHALHVAVTGEASGHYAAFKDEPWRHVRKALAEGYLKEGKQTLGIEPPPSAALPPTAFVHFLQNHDQVGNRALGERLHTMLDAAAYRLLTEVLFLSPQIPLAFMGDDHLSRQPFRFFSDFTGTIGREVFLNRYREAENFGGYPAGAGPQDVMDPNEPATFERSKLDWQEAESDEANAWRAFLQRLLAIRRAHVIPLLPGVGGYAGRVVREDDSVLFIDWRLSGGTLRLRANISDTDCSLGDEPGELIYASAPDAPADLLLPWSIRVLVER
jgi:malto-oligosyltrehalose trehalohydrolase